MMLHERQVSSGVHTFRIEFDLIDSPGVAAEPCTLITKMDLTKPRQFKLVNFID